MDKLNLNKKSYSKTQYERVIDTKFSQLATSIPTNSPPPSSISVNEFFQNYNDLLFQIPKLGDTNSHEYLIKTSSEYIGESVIDSNIQALIEEINSLQQQNLELNQQLVNLSISSSKQI